MDAIKALDAIDTALQVISGIANTPGINLIPYVSTVAAVAGLASKAITIGKDVTPLLEELKSTFDGGQPPQAAMDALDAKIALARQRLLAPMPPLEPGEPE